MEKSVGLLLDGFQLSDFFDKLFRLYDLAHVFKLKHGVVAVGKARAYPLLGDNYLNVNVGDVHLAVLLQRRFYVIGGIAVASLGTFFLIYLSEGTFNDSGRRAEDGDDPHPENGAVSAEADSCGHTDDVTRTYTGGSGYHQRLE